MRLYFTQIEEPDPDLRTQLETRGWTCEHLPFRRVIICDERVLNTYFGGFDAVIISSKHAARWLLRQEPAMLPPLAVVGNATSALFPSHALLFCGEAPPNAAELVDRLQGLIHQGAEILFLRGADAKDTIVDGLRHHRITEKIVYRTERFSKSFEPLSKRAMVYFQAPSTVRDFREIYGHAPFRTAAIGPVTAATVEEVGWTVDFTPSRPENPFFAAELPSPENFAVSKE